MNFVKTNGMPNVLTYQRYPLRTAYHFPLPKGHGRLIDADAVLVEPFGNTYKDMDIAETIIEADKEN